MRTFVVELVREGVEGALLTSGVGGGRRRRLLLEREVHALMPRVLLRLTGLDALETDAQTYPPDRELREARDAGTRERSAVVGADGVGKAELAEG